MAGDDERWKLEDGIPHQMLFDNGVYIGAERVKHLLEEWTTAA